MRITINCPKCFMENQHKEPLSYLTKYEIDYFDDRLVSLSCDASHKINIGIRNEKFQILFSSSINTYLSGHTIESTSSAWAAFERFIEFMIRTFTYSHMVGKESFEAGFKDVAKMSERQVGGFVFLYLLSVKAPYNYESRLNKIKKKRNAFIHNGSIPDLTNTFEFLEVIYNEILYILNEVFRHPELREAMTQVLYERNPKSPDGKCYIYNVIPDIFYSFEKGDLKVENKSFATIIAEHKERKERNS
ncbi:Uncharacterised protein [Yersinia pseudotuberculosis]|uniref:hypothetical protein n=1 Tax=Yersinia pseudotuberculosis TaxID=633 RepID=UPI0005DB26E3|nr:hypothetical protein [Yersinia pseudotuberculosis]BCU90732.1 hypothetical protein YP72344_22270 [Yersinia pseudotuberculosis]CNF68532.1 Uncharacterised protein [Yersinia pseudotuberculosis]CNL44269.1 Uncharacterised protein [Yersinia pseudotuberculosis]